MKFLADYLLEEIGENALEKSMIPPCIRDNLKYELRPYQEEAFRRFLLFQSQDFSSKRDKPYHLLYNMATGSGKTLIIAGLILHLFEQGYRNFLFFVNSSNIIRKTKSNFLQSSSSKYLFADRLVFDHKEVLIKEVDNFEEYDEENINIKFTTIQQLHSDLNTFKENNLTYEDFKGRKMVLIADEAHHLVAGTKSGKETNNWENTVQRIFKADKGNWLLEFTATIETTQKEMRDYYADKVLFKYDLAQFRKDRYSKEINLIRSNYGESGRMLQALILHLYRQELANVSGINLKPVVLFKTQRTINESEENKLRFHQLIANLSGEQIDKIRASAQIPVVQKAFAFFDKRGLLSSEIAGRLQIYFREENCLSANKEEEAEKNQILLNTLEDTDNPIRAVFAVQKLNEGWDVLNLFDIVRLQGERGKSVSRSKKITLSEAQLIGRGARYFPFKWGEREDRYRRKFDDDPMNDLKILEELYYHTKEDNLFISGLKTALTQTGIYEEKEKKIYWQTTLKSSFKQSDFYKKGVVFYNKRVRKNQNASNLFKELKKSKTPYVVNLSSGLGRKLTLLQEGVEKEAPSAEKKTLTQDKEIISSKKKLQEIPKQVLRFALSQNNFFHFDRLSRYLPDIHSLSEFINEESFLGGQEIIFRGPAKRLKTIDHEDYLQAVNGLLIRIEKEMKNCSVSYGASDWKYKRSRLIIKNEEERVLEVGGKEEEKIASRPWYIYETYRGSGKERNVLELWDNVFQKMRKEVKYSYLIPCPKEVTLYSNQGFDLRPGFLLIGEDHHGVNHQIFVRINKKEPLREAIKKEAIFNAKPIWTEVDGKRYKISIFELRMENGTQDLEKKLKECLKG